MGLAAGILALGPALAPGYLLWYDMVFVPGLGLGDRVLGVDGSVPRAVPGDLFVAVLSQLAPGWVVQKMLLLLVFVAVGAGVGRLLPSGPAAGAAAAAATWNPYVAERLAIGHWTFLLGYAVLPWLAAAAGAARTGTPRARVALCGWVVVLACTGSSISILAIPLVALVLLLPRPARGARVTSGLAALTWLGANAPWWFPFLALAPRGVADPEGVAAFTARADTPLGLVPSLALTGGIWNRSSWPPDRMLVSVSLVAFGFVLLVIGLAARRHPWRTPGPFAGLLGAGVLALLLTVAGSLPAGRDALTWVVVHVPGGGVLRDSQKLLALWAIAFAVLAGHAVEQLRHVVSHPSDAAGERRGQVLGSARATLGIVLPLLVALWPLATMPSLAWAGAGRWSAVDYPRGHLEVARYLDEAPPGAVAVFPWTLYRRYDWNAGRVLLDPWQRLVDRRVLVNDDLPLVEGVVRGENPDAARVARALRRGGDLGPVLRAVGVRYVLELTDQPPAPGVPGALTGARVVLRRPDLVLRDLGPVDPTRARFETTAAARAGGWRWTGLVLGGLSVGALAAGGVLARRRSPRPSPR